MAIFCFFALLCHLLQSVQSWTIFLPAELSFKIQCFILSDLLQDRSTFQSRTQSQLSSSLGCSLECGPSYRPVLLMLAPFWESLTPFKELLLLSPSERQSVEVHVRLSVVGNFQLQSQSHWLSSNASDFVNLMQQQFLYPVHTSSCKTPEDLFSSEHDGAQKPQRIVNGPEQNQGFSSTVRLSFQSDTPDSVSHCMPIAHSM